MGQGQILDEKDKC